MNSLPELDPIKLFERRDNLTHFTDRTYTKIPTTSMSGTTMGFDLCPDKTFVPKDEIPFARFSDNTGVCLIVRDEMLGADTSVFFVYDKCSENFSGRRLKSERSHRAHNGCGATLHVIAPPTIHAIAVHSGF